MILTTLAWIFKSYREPFFVKYLMVKIDLKKTFMKMWRLTESQFLPRVRGQRKPKERHGGDEDAGDDQVEEVVEGATPKMY